MSQATAPIEVPEITRGDRIYTSIVAFLAWSFAVYDYTLFGTLLPVMATSFHWTTAQSTAIATWVSVGVFVVSFLVGPLTDAVGRRLGLIITTAGAAVSSGLTALTPGALYLIIVRAFSGLGYSEQAVNSTYLSEILSSENRGFSYSFVQGGWPIGVMFGAIMTTMFIGGIGWRGTYLVATAPLIIIVALGFKLKETPRFRRIQYIKRLERQGKREEALRLGKTYGVDAQRAEKFSYLQLFDVDVRRHTIFLAVSFLLNWIGIEVFIVLGTTVLTKGTGVTFHNALLFLIVSNAVTYVGYVLAGWIGDKIGRRTTIAVGWLLSGIAYTLLMLLGHSFWSALILYSLGLFFIIGPYSALLSYMGESFPTRMRATGVSFVNAMGPIGGILGALLFTVFLNATNNVVLTSIIVGSLATFLSGFMILGANNVKPGQDLEDIAV